MPLFAFDVFELGPASRAQAVSRLFDTTEKACVMFKAVLKPVLFRLEADHTPAGLPWRVMTISCASASRRKRDRSSLTSDKGTSFIPDLRVVRAMTRPPIGALLPEPQQSRRTFGQTVVAAAYSGVNCEVAHPTRFERVTFAFGAI